MATSDIVTAFLDGLLERESDVGATFTFAGNTYPCSGGDSLVWNILGDGGFAQRGKTIIAVRLGLFAAGAAIPNQKQSLTYSAIPGDAGRTLRVDSVDRVFNSVLVLTCQEPNTAA